KFTPIFHFNFLLVILIGLTYCLHYRGKVKKDFKREDKEYWAKATNEEKFKTISYLRECFYGPEATTGRLQRLYTFSKRK
ncbi:MAG: hypothetical protein JW982_08475, partial [Spirochaetes bacterium]|nr:hypothetical protein [Spirochaetota bacterium]